MSHPKRVDRFRQWSKDMIEGATVDRPRLTSSGGKSSRRRSKNHRASARRRRKNNAKKEKS